MQKETSFRARVVTVALFLPLAGILLMGAVLPSAATKRATLAANYDLDAVPANSTEEVLPANIVDSTSYSLSQATLDTPRPLVVTITDADNSTTCVITIVGTQADGTAITSTVSFSTAGAKTPSPNYNWATLTSVSTGVCTGEAAGDTLQVGTTSTIPVQYFGAYGARLLEQHTVDATTKTGHDFRDVFAWYVAPLAIKTSGLTTTVVSSTSSAGALTPVDVGDIIKVNANRGEMQERVVVTNADNDTITVEENMNLPAGTRYYYKKLFRGPDTEDAWIPVTQYRSVNFIFITAQIGNNAHSFVQCRNKLAATSPVQVDTDAITAAGSVVTTIDLTSTPWDQCRAGLQFDTDDTDGDSGSELEKMTIQFTGAY